MRYSLIVVALLFGCRSQNVTSLSSTQNGRDERNWLRKVSGRVWIARSCDHRLVALKIQPEGVENGVIDSMPELDRIEELYLCHTLVSNGEIDEIITKLPNLRMLDLTMCVDLDCRAAAALARLVHLRKVYVAGTNFDGELDCWREKLGDRLRVDAKADDKVAKWLDDLAPN